MSSSTLHLTFSSESLAEPRANCLDRLTSKLLTSSYLFSALWLDMLATAPGFLRGFQGPELRSLCLHKQTCQEAMIVLRTLEQGN